MAVMIAESAAGFLVDLQSMPRTRALLTPANASGVTVCVGLGFMVAHAPSAALVTYAVPVGALWLVYFLADEHDDAATRLLKAVVPLLWPLFLAAHDLVRDDLIAWATARRQRHDFRATALRSSHAPGRSPPPRSA